MRVRGTDKFIRLFFPLRCPVCDRPVAGLKRDSCPGCEERFVPVMRPRCAQCSKPLPEDEEGLCADCAEVEKTVPDSLIYMPSFDIITVFGYFMSRPLATFEKVDLRKDVEGVVRDILAEYTDRYLGVDVLRTSIGLEV